MTMRDASHLLHESADAGEITITFGGDTSLGDWYLERAPDDVKLRLSEDPLSFFSDLEPVLSDSDLLIINLETVLARNPKSPLEGRKKYLGWDTPERTLGVLKALGVGSVSLANNHTMDFGPEVLLETIARTEQAGISVFGAGSNLRRASDPLKATVTMDDLTRHVYVLGALKNTTTLREEYNFFATDLRSGTNPLATRRIAEQITRLREADSDALIILYPHWGQNYQWASDLMWRTSKRFLNAGADLILGHGAHMLQEVEQYDSGSVVFSLGNLVFNSRGRYHIEDAAPYSLVARLTLSVQDGAWHGELRLYPIVSDNLSTHYRPRPVDEAEAKEVLNVLAARKQSPQEIVLAHDSRGWHLQFDAALSPRLKSSALSRTRSAGLFRSTRQTPRTITADAQSRPAEELILRPSELPRYGPGSTHECLARALAEREIPYTSYRAELRGTRRPTIRFNLGQANYVITAARIYREENGRLRRVDGRAGGLVKRKDVANSILRAYGFTAPQGVAFKSGALREARLYREAVADRFQYGFCVKPVNGGLGKHVYVGLKRSDEFAAAFESAAADYEEILVEETLVGEVYRFLWVAGRVVAARLGVPMNVVGDGVSSVRELIDAKNVLRAKNPIHKYYPLRLGDSELEHLAKQGLDADHVPRLGEEVLLGTGSNLHAGADVVDVTDDVHESYLGLVAEAVSVIPDMFVCGADVIIADHRVPASAGNYGIIELNTGPGIGSHHYPWSGKPREVARDIIDALIQLERRSVSS